MEIRHRAGRLRHLAWAAALSLVAPMALGVSPPPGSLELPEVVVRGIDDVRLEAQRRGVLPLEPARIAQAAVRVEVPSDVLPTPELQRAPPVQSPGCAYRNPMTAAIARAAKGSEGLYRSALQHLSRDELDKAAYFLARLRDDHPGDPRADDAAFWLAEIKLREGSADEALAFLRLVHGSYAQEAAYRKAWLLDDRGRRAEAREVWVEVAKDSGSPHRPEALYRLGIDRMQAGEYAEAAGRFTTILALVEDGTAVDAQLQESSLLALGLARRAQGNAAAAEESLVRFLLEYPDALAAPSARVALAWSLLEQGKPREAAQRFQWLIESSPPTDVAVRALYGDIRARADLGDYEGAVARLGPLEATGPEGPWVGWARGDVAWLAFREGRYEDALGWYEDALRVWDGAGADVPRYMAAESLYLLGRYAEAASAFQGLPPASPLYPTALHRAGLANILGQEPAAAASLFETVLNQFPGYPEADQVWAWLGEARLRLGKTEAALQAFGSVPRDSPAHAQALYGRAWIAFEAQRWEEASELFDLFLRLYPEDRNREEALLALARSHFNRRELRPALAALEELEDRASSPLQRDTARFYRGWMFARSGRKTVARELLRELLSSEPRGPFAARSHQTLGWLAFAEGDYAGAQEHFEAVLALVPGGELEREAKQKRADSLFNLGRYDQALQAYGELGETPEALYGQSLCYDRLGRTEDLARIAGEFTRRFPADPRATDLYFALAEARSQAGDLEGAARAYGRAAETSSDETRTAEARLEGARTLVRAGHLDPAEDLLEALTGRADALGLAALRLLAEIIEVRGDPETARKTWDEVAARAEKEERIAALRAAARWARAALQWDAAHERLEAALREVTSEALRQALLADLGELLLLEGRPAEAVETLRTAAEQGTGPEGLRAFLALGTALETQDRDQEALETYLRIGYLYAMAEPEVARASLRAGELLEQREDRGRARAVYEKVASEGRGEWADEARARLASLGSP